MDARFDSSGSDLGCVPVYVQRCDDCKSILKAGVSLAESAAGGLCGPCRREQAEEAQWESDRDLRAMEAHLDDVAEGPAAMGDE